MRHFIEIVFHDNKWGDFISNNSNLRKADAVKNDEFYTSFDDIEIELIHYQKFFRNKIILCNCDNPRESNFWKYFHLKFGELGLKRLMCIHYDPNGDSSYRMDYCGGDDSDISGGINTVYKLNGNGDFRDSECIAILQEADIVVTNPPFSLFREYIAQLIEYKKQFVIVGNMNALAYKEIFPLIKNNVIWSGHTNRIQGAYRVPSHYTGAYMGEDGNYYKKLNNTMWFTNLPIEKRSERLLSKLTMSYAEHTDEYLTYDNYPAIEVAKIKNIPNDYYGVMGVPITFIHSYNPDEFEILGVFNNYDPATCGDGQIYGDAIYADNYKHLYRGPVINGRPTYIRILIKRK